MFIIFKQIILDGEPVRWSVNEQGQVRNDETNKIINGTIMNSYRYINFRWNGKQKNKAVHRLVAETFLPNPNNYPCVRHKDNNKMNNNLENLEWTTLSNTMIFGNKGVRKPDDETNKKEIDGEIWKNFRDTKYQVSNMGRIKNTATGRMSYGGKGPGGYKKFTIHFLDGTKKTFLVHRLVYECFVSPDFTEINHINGKKDDNRLENLEDVSHSENMRKAANETNAWNFRKVAQYDKEGNCIQIFLNASDAARAMGILPSSMRNCIRLRNGRHKDFIFKYLDKDEASSTIS